MIRINLLPHREEKRKARRQQFYVMLGLLSVLAAVIWFLGFSIINREINVQNEKNEFLKREIASLDKEIAEIKKIQEVFCELSVVTGDVNVESSASVGAQDIAREFAELGAGLPYEIWVLK